MQPSSPVPWIKWAELEKGIGEIERYRAIFNLGLENTNLEMPEIVWRAYINNEIELKEYDNVRALFEKLLEKSKHLKIWISFA